MDNAKPAASTSPPLSTAALSALRRGNKIEAIKIVREERNIGLKEAKDAVDEYVRADPSLQSALSASQAEAKSGALRWLVVVIALAVAAWYFLK